MFNQSLLESALTARLPLLTEPHNTALRLFNGFFEGWLELIVDLYGATLVIFNYADDPANLSEALPAVADFYRARLPWLVAVLVKTRHSPIPAERNGKLLWGGPPARRVQENGVWYALDLTLHQDASFYVDMRGLRAWLKANASGLSVLNIFAYTGSLGASCRAGGAARILQVDLNRRFLNLAKDTFNLNGWPVQRADFLAEDFFRLAGQLRRRAETYDLVILDPPFFSATSAGRVDLVGDSARLINKVRPLVRGGGRLIAVNNALFTSGEEYVRVLEGLGADGYLALEEIIPVSEDVAGYPATRLSFPPANPAPFNHPTKIVVLRIKSKSSST
jgi:23S rRNA (cytosine1962-C5)-methyltransferase